MLLQSDGRQDVVADRLEQERKHLHIDGGRHASVNVLVQDARQVHESTQLDEIVPPALLELLYVCYSELLEQARHRDRRLVVGRRLGFRIVVNQVVDDVEVVKSLVDR